MRLSNGDLGSSNQIDLVSFTPECRVKPLFNRATNTVTIASNKESTHRLLNFRTRTEAAEKVWHMHQRRRLYYGNSQHTVVKYTLHKIQENMIACPGNTATASTQVTIQLLSFVKGRLSVKEFVFLIISFLIGCREDTPKVSPCLPGNLASFSKPPLFKLVGKIID